MNESRLQYHISISYLTHIPISCLIGMGLVTHEYVMSHITHVSTRACREKKVHRDLTTPSQLHT